MNPENHQLRNLIERHLTIIRGGARLIYSDDRTHPIMKSTAARIERDCEHLLLEVEQLLNEGEK